MIEAITWSYSKVMTDQFYSHLIYGCSIWGLTMDANLKIIEVLQKKCLRILTFSDFNSHTNPLFLQLKLLKVCDII